VSYWLVKTEPTTYSFDDLLRDKQTVWDGVRNNLALRHLREMQKGDAVMIYHSGEDKSIVGLAEVIRGPYADPKQNDEKLVVVDLKAKRRLAQAVTLGRIKSDERFAQFALVRMPRLSVMPVPEDVWGELLAMAER